MNFYLIKPYRLASCENKRVKNLKNQNSTSMIDELNLKGEIWGIKISIKNLQSPLNMKISKCLSNTNLT
ncbi:hypothetical protein BpHYR1_028427 [Brachionus plicatilis]|uniref:Uncharacterized protein n=1 Tax=Brachionus plicatilis TaxID=10195 RepID=A0A3M7S320_BRAPC|nr:hypothetical protein BpHYR1_028427 [Brachionus plicatilis]